MKRIQQYKSLIAAFILLMVIVLIYAFYEGSYLYNVLGQVCCYFVAVLGLNFITGMTGQPMLGMAGVFAIGSYVTGILTTKCGFTAWAAIPVVLLAGLIVGLLLGYPSLRVSGVYLSFTTIGFSEIVRILLLNMTALTGGGTGIKSIPNYSLFGFEMVSMKEKLPLYIAIVILISLFTSYIVRSKWGRSFFAVRDNVEAVPSCGINVTSVKLIAFCLATMLGSLAGSMHAHMNNYINPSTYSQTLSANMLSMLIIGGMGSIWGSLFGTVIVICIPEALRFLGRWNNVLYAVLMLVLIVVMPGGIVNILKRKDGRMLQLKRLLRIFIGGRS